jgi:hypothetical protein
MESTEGELTMRSPIRSDGIRVKVVDKPTAT